MRSPLRIIIVLLLLVGVGVTGYFLFSRGDPAMLLQRGDEAVQRRDWAGAERFAMQLEERGEKEAAALLRGRSFGAQGRFPAVLNALGKFDPDSPLFPEAARLIGMALFGMEQHMQAEPYLLRAAENNPNLADVRRALGVIAYDQGRLDEAIGHMLVVAELEPSDGKPLRLIGLIQKDMDQPVDAIAAYQKALERELPSAMRTEAMIELGEIYLKQQQLDDLEAIVNQLANDPSPRLAVLQAEVAVATLSADEAVRRVDALMLQQSMQPDLLRLRAKLHRTQNQPDRAIALLEQAAKLDPADYRIPYELVQVYEGTGQKELAAKAKARVDAIQADLTQMSKLSHEAMEKPRDATVRRQLAEVARRLGKNELSERWLKAADDLETAPR